MLPHLVVFNSNSPSNPDWQSGERFMIFLLPKAIQYAAILASLVFLGLLWHRTKILGFAGLAAVMFLTQVYSLVVVPYMVSISGMSSLVFVNALVSMVFSILVALACWHIYAHTKQAPRNSSYIDA
jgi:hypothetical protein